MDELSAWAASQQAPEAAEAAEGASQLDLGPFFAPFASLKAASSQLSTLTDFTVLTVLTALTVSIQSPLYNDCSLTSARKDASCMRPLPARDALCFFDSSERLSLALFESF